MNGYSHIDASMVSYAQRAATTQMLRRIHAWSDAERTKAAVAQRRKTADGNFWAFDATYFPAVMYDQGKTNVCSFHRSIVGIDDRPGVQIILGPRGHGKTATMKKKLLWRMLTNRTRLAGVYCETITKASAIIADLALLLEANDRIVHDYNYRVEESNADALTIACGGHTATIGAFSEGRSVRGFARGFARPDYILADDVETLSSPFGDEAVRLRLQKLREAHASLSDNSTMTVLGNNFEERSATNLLLREQARGILPPNWRVHVFRGWNRGKPLWAARYPAADEKEFRRMVGALDEADYQGNYQMNPVPPDGFIFDRQALDYYNTLPADAKGVIYLDPNLALKNKGDTTAIVRLLWSPRTSKFYLSAGCKSYNDPGALLDAALTMRTANVRGMALDGHVSQESHWTHHIRAWCREHAAPYPNVEFKRYRTDELATNFAQVYNSGDVLFDSALRHSEEGSRFFAQFFSFRSKKAKRQDDAPDAAICAYQFLTERRLVRRINHTAVQPSIIIPDIY